MSAPATSPGRTAAGRGGVIAALAITTTISYGVLYYAFSALLEPMRQDLRISPTTATGALTLASLISAVLAVPIGRRLDTHGGRGVMSLGSVIACAAVLAWSQAQNTTQLYAAFVAVGIASAMVLYPPAFAVVVAVTIPLHALALRRTRPNAAPREVARTSPARVLRDAGFWLLATVFVLHSAALAIIGVHLVTYLTKLGHSPTAAATLAGLLGLLSVTGRITVSVLRRWLPMTSISAAVITLQGVALAILPAAGHSTGGATGCLIVFGLGFGVASIAKPAIILERYGDQGYATISGLLGTPTTLASAIAPLAAAALASALGYTPLILSAAAACALAGLTLAATRFTSVSRR